MVGGRYPSVVRLWDNAWEEFIPFLDYDIEIRTMLCSTDEIVKGLVRADRLSGGGSGLLVSCVGEDDATVNDPGSPAGCAASVDVVASAQP